MMDDRALATNILLFFATIVLIAVLTALFQDVMLDIIQVGKDNTTGAASEDGYRHLTQAVNALPWLLAILAFVMLISSSAAEADLR